MNAEKSGTPAATWPTQAEHDDCVDHWFVPSTPARELIARQVAAREAAAYERGRDEGRAEARPELDEREAEWHRHFHQIEDLMAENDTLRAELAAAEQRGAEKARAELADRYIEQLRRQEAVHDACEGHALCDLVAELTRAAAAES